MSSANGGIGSGNRAGRPDFAGPAALGLSDFRHSWVVSRAM